MNILHITATHLNPTGGVPVVLKNLIEEQNKIQGVKSILLSLRANTEMIDNSMFFYRKTSSCHSFIENFKPDVVILHSFFYTEYSQISKFLIRKNIPYFIEPHGSFGKAALKKSCLKKYVANRTIFRQLIQKAYGYIFLSEEEKNDSYYRKDHDVVIPNGIQACSKRYNVEKSNTLFFIGRYDIHHKGLDLLFEALKLLDQEGKVIEIDMYGSGTDKEVKYIKDSINHFKHIRCVDRGPLYGDSKERELSKHAIMILTSRYEGFPMTVLESWRMGIPCIVTPGTNVSSMVKGNNVGWVADFSPKSVAETIMSAIEEYSNDKEGYINRSIDYVEKNYQWQDIANNSITLLEKELSQKAII